MTMKFFKMSTFLIFILLAGCGNSNLVELEKEFDGYQLTIKASPGSIGKVECTNLMKNAAEVFKQSVGASGEVNSIIEKLNNERGPLKVSDDIYRLLGRVNELQGKSDGYWNPFLGEVRRLWGLNESTPSFPSTDSLEQAINRASNTRLKLSGNNQVELEGSGNLFLGRAVLGWALDEAAAVMIDGGVEAGLLEADGVHRHWGEPSADSKWSIIISALPNDSSEYKIESDAGGICEINLREFNTEGRIITDVIYPFDGEPLEGMINLSVWAPDAMQACIFGETMYAMDRLEMLHWSDELEDVGVFFIRQDDIGVIGETNMRMSPWISKP